jgi:hypothetical protein
VTETARRRQRPMLTTAIKQAAKAGVRVVGADIRPDGSIALKFADTQDVNANSAKSDETPEQLKELL